MNNLVYCISHVKSRKKSWNNREIENLVLYNFLPSYSFRELIHILMHNIVLYTSIYSSFFCVLNDYSRDL